MNEILEEYSKLRKIRDVAHMKLLNAKPSNVRMCKMDLEAANANLKRYAEVKGIQADI
jgi:hypothetical protein|tara:strand:+ start:82 stop:255 length:174 start_codon:yes stop_codon:yes gene_type:complete